jgi:hypothetical protein
MNNLKSILGVSSELVLLGTAWAGLFLGARYYGKNTQPEIQKPTLNQIESSLINPSPYLVKVIAESDKKTKTSYQN